jgi:hypothetical protein
LHRLAIAALLVFGAIPGVAEPGLAWQQGINSLDSGWRTHSGNQTDWAAPNFDDSTWQSTELGASLLALPGAYDERWYRLHLNLPAGHPPLAMVVNAVSGTFEVYLNGRLQPGARLRLAWGIGSRPTSSVLPLEISSSHNGSDTVVVALHTRIPNSSLFHYLPYHLDALLGTREMANQAAAIARIKAFDTRIIQWGIALLLLLAGFALILFSRLQPDHREYLWMGLNLLFLTSAAFALSPATFVFITLPAIYLSPITQIEFVFTFAGRRVTPVWRAYQGLLLLALATLPLLLWIGTINFYPYQAVEAALLVPATFFLPVMLFIWYRQGNREAGWLILPSLLPLLSVCVVDLGILGMWVGSRPLASLVDRVPLGPLSVRVDDPSVLIYLLAICIVIFLRFNRVSHQQARNAAELDAAREIQQRLVPLRLPTVPGYRMEAAYLPAQEVGGDFYQVLEQRDGSTLVLVGDVSGKGLKAAMQGVLAIGAARTLASEQLSPGTLLARLNAEMTGSQDGGFITCLCVHIKPDGTATCANAGHLSPYSGGKEFELESGLPLGIVPDVNYRETALKLAPGELLTLLSDGVVEARNSKGELFGFDRTRAISRESAQYIAEAARQFGQEDDITVLSVSLVGG